LQECINNQCECVKCDSDPGGGGQCPCPNGYSCDDGGNCICTQTICP
jgi:hypothetical protein